MAVLSGIIVRNGDHDRPRIGIDWRAVAALGGLVLALGTLAMGLLTERVMVLAHVAKGESMVVPVQNHLDNVGPYRHMDIEQYRQFVALHWQIDEMQKDLRAIKRHLRVKDDDLRMHMGVDMIPPGRDDP